MSGKGKKGSTGKGKKSTSIASADNQDNYLHLPVSVDDIKQTYMCSDDRTTFIRIDKIRLSMRKDDPCSARLWNQADVDQMKRNFINRGFSVDVS